MKAEEQFGLLCNLEGISLAVCLVWRRSSSPGLDQQTPLLAAGLAHGWPPAAPPPEMSCCLQMLRACLLWKAWALPGVAAAARGPGLTHSAQGPPASKQLSHQKPDRHTGTHHRCVMICNAIEIDQACIGQV